MRVIVPLTLWRRPQITELVYRSLRGLKTEHEVTMVGVASPEDPDFDDHRRLADRYLDDFDSCPNSPLGAKANHRLRVCRELDWDWLLLLGSDDVVSPNLLDAYPLDSQLWGWSDCYYLDSGRFFHWVGYDRRVRNESAGAGRMFHRSVCERLDWEMWDPKLERYLDGSCTQRLRSAGYSGIPHKPLPDGHFIVDVKSEHNLTPLSRFDPAALEEKEMPEWLRSLLS